MTFRAPHLPADLEGEPDNLACPVACPVNRHVVRVGARAARLPVCACPVLRIVRYARLLVAVEARVADEAPAIRCKDLALSGKLVAAVARVSVRNVPLAASHDVQIVALNAHVEDNASHSVGQLGVNK